MSSAGRTRASSAGTNAGRPRPAREVVDGPDPAQRRRRRVAAVPACTVSTSPGADLVELVEIASGRGTPPAATRCDTDAVVSWASSSGGREQRAQGHQHRTDPHGGERHDRPLGAVGRQQAHPVALDDARRPTRAAANDATGGIELRIGQRARRGSRRPAASPSSARRWASQAGNGLGAQAALSISRRARAGRACRSTSWAPPRRERPASASAPCRRRARLAQLRSRNPSRSTLPSGARTSAATT